MEPTFDYIGFILLLLYFVVFLLGAHQLSKIINSKNRAFNFRNGIMVALTVSSLVRVIFWTINVAESPLPTQLVMAIFFLPVWLDFASLSLLAVFYAETVYINGEMRKLPRRICLLVNSIFFVLNLTISLLLNNPNNNQQFESNVAIVYIIYAALLDFSIAFSLGYLGYQFIAHNTDECTVKRWILPRSINEFATVNWIVVICYLLRGFLVSIFSTQAVAPYTATKVDFSYNHPVTSLLLLCFFIIAEIIPNSSILYLLWHKKNVRMLKFNSDISERDGATEDAKLIDDFLARQTSVDDSKVSILFESAFHPDDDEDDDDKFGDDDHGVFVTDRSSLDNKSVIFGSGLRGFYRTPSPQVPQQPFYASQIHGSTGKLSAMGLTTTYTGLHNSSAGVAAGIQSQGSSFEDLDNTSSMMAISSKNYANTIGPRDILRNASTSSVP